MKRIFFCLLVLPTLLFGCKKAEAPETEVKPVVQVSTAKATRTDMRETITVNGTLAPLPDSEAKVAPLVAGRILKVFVKSGDVVTKGQVLAQMDPGPLNGQIAQQQATLKASQEALQQARLNYALQQSAQRSSATQAEQNLRAQQVALEKAVEGSRPQEIAQAQAAVTSAAAALQSAQQSLSRSQTLFSEGLLARKDLEATQAQERTAQAQYDSARQALSLAKQGNRPQDIEAAKIAVRQAQDQLKAARDQVLQTQSKAQDVRIAAQQVAAAEGTLQALKAQLAGLTIRAPLSGTVGGRTVNPGEFLDTTGAVCTVVDLNKLRVLLGVPAGQIKDVRVGQLVEFTVESHPGRTYGAAVSVISSAVDPNTNTISIEALANNPNRELEDDGFAKAKVILRNRPGALSIPAEAIVDRDGKSIAYVLSPDNIAHEKELKTGVRDGNQVEVLTGLNEGDRVVVVGAFELQDGTQVRTEQ